MFVNEAAALGGDLVAKKVAKVETEVAPVAGPGPVCRRGIRWLYGELVKQSSRPPSELVERTCAW